MILFYVNQVNPRWIYTLDFIFKVRGIKYQITDDLERFNNSSKHKVNLTQKETTAPVNFTVSKLLEEVEIRPFLIKKGKFLDQEVLQLDGVSCAFSSIFYVLTRYEEYIDKKRDKHGRFQGKQSVLYQFNWVEKPICDTWAQAIIDFLKSEFQWVPEMKVSTCHLQPTFDIDNTFAYLHKQGTRKLFSILKDLLKCDFKRIKERIRVENRVQNDPYNTFDYIFSLKKRGLEPKIFWLLGDYAKYDRNLRYENDEHQKLIRKASEFAEIGIHPSYSSNYHLYKVKQEIRRLNDILGKENQIACSRQHFLKVQLPQTYTTLLTNSIYNDYSMGFADIPGFRVGTAHVVKWYDLSQDTSSNLKIHPLIYMDGTLKDYLQLSTQQAKEKIHLLHQQVCKYGGQFTFLWHNDTIRDEANWKGWKEVLEFTLALKHENT